jgi:hypothetical protein
MHSIDLKKLKTRVEGVDALIIWQYVRCSSKYQTDYDRLVKKSKSLGEYKDFLHEQFCENWSISHAIHYEIEKPDSKEFYFEKVGARFFKNANAMTSYIEWNSDLNNILLAIHPDSDSKLVIQQIEKAMSLRKMSVTRIKGSSLNHLADNFIVFYLSKCRKLRNAEVKSIYNSWNIGGKLQDQQIKSKIKSFLKIASISPNCFFVAPR